MTAYYHQLDIHRIIDFQTRIDVATQYFALADDTVAYSLCEVNRNIKDMMSKLYAVVKQGDEDEDQDENLFSFRQRVSQDQEVSVYTPPVLTLDDIVHDFQSIGAALREISREKMPHLLQELDVCFAMIEREFLFFTQEDTAWGDAPKFKEREMLSVLEEVVR